MKINCNCGETILDGEIGKGKKHVAFITRDKPKGEIHKNGSNNPKNWTGICSKCQRKKKEKKHEI